jgi:hypothetical protein
LLAEFHTETTAWNEIEHVSLVVYVSRPGAGGVMAAARVPSRVGDWEEKDDLARKER